MASGSGAYAGVNKGRAARAGKGKASLAKQRKPQRNANGKGYDGAPF